MARHPQSRSTVPPRVVSRAWRPAVDRRMLGALAALLALALALGSSRELSAAVAEDAGDAGAAGEALVSKLQALRPGITVQAVRQSPLPELVEIELAGGTTLYGSKDGRFLIAGDLYDISGDDLVNLAEQRRAAQRHERMTTARKPVVFTPEGDVKASVTVFTDVDCGYCRKLHQEVPRLNELGIEVRYLAYPRAGVGSESYRKIVSAWCAADPNTAITRLKAGQQIPELECKNPVADHFQLGQEVGVRGTPAIVLEDGTMLPGYLPADELAATLGI